MVGTKLTGLGVAAPHLWEPAWQSIPVSMMRFGPLAQPPMQPARHWNRCVTKRSTGSHHQLLGSEVASLMTELGRAGFSPKQIEEMTGAVMNLARATGTDATVSSGIMSATIRQFSLEATDAVRVSDRLTAAANMSFNSVRVLGEALQYAGPVAADANMSLEETLAVLGTLGTSAFKVVKRVPHYADCSPRRSRIREVSKGIRRCD